MSGIDQISEKTGHSKASISRALNNCGSVSSEVKEEIVRAAAEIGYIPPQKKRIKRPAGGFLIAAALPETPAFFWNEAAEGMKEAAMRHEDIRLVQSLFQRLGSEKDILYCLDYLIDLQPDILIAAAPAFASVQRKLAGCNIPVIAFSESGHLHPLFYVGADFYRDGVLLARGAAPKMKDCRKIVRIDNEPMPMIHLRNEGFRREMMNLCPMLSWTDSVETADWSPSEAPSRLARVLKHREFDAIYVSDGQLPQVMTALGKLKSDHDIYVAGFERAGLRFQNDPRLAAVMEQDIRQQGTMCLEGARTYLLTGEIPEGRRLLIQSRLTTGERINRKENRGSL